MPIRRLLMNAGFAAIVSLPGWTVLAADLGFEIPTSAGDRKVSVQPVGDRAV